jgi:Bacterial antitoxin of type II TA system, VapB
MAKVRTNIEIDDGYVETIMNRYGLRTKKDARVTRGASVSCGGCSNDSSCFASTPRRTSTAP